MSEETTSNPILSKKSQSPTKITVKDEDKKNVINYNKTEQISNKNKAFLLNEKLSPEFTEEDELEGLTITYKEQERKMKAITLDLLLKKIITENFIEKNPIQIYSFCQQCFCFMDKEIIFNKIFNCYNFYKEKKVPITQIGNLIKFLNILVIEMYEYYSKIKMDDPILGSIRNFYNLLINELCQVIDKEVQQKAETEENLNINELQNKLDEYNEEENEPETKDNNIHDERCSSFLDQEINRERYGTVSGKKEDGRFSSYLDGNVDNNSKDNISRNTINTSFKNNEKEGKEENKKKKGFKSFFHIKKEKPVKLEDKNAKEEEEKQDELQEKLKQIQSKKNASTPEEEIINSLQNIIILFSLEQPGKKDLKQAKSNVDFYKEIYKKMADAIGKPMPDMKTKHAMIKSITVGNINKKKLKLHENDGFFDVLDWDEKEIGEKLIYISKNLINKVNRREIYKAIYLKKNKETTSPNVLENIDKFNRLVFFIIQDILSYDFAKDRAKIMEKWIKIADYCKSRKDYNDCVAINSALNNYIITGLQKTDNKILKDKKELLKQINKFCRLQGNYKKLRQDMKSLAYNEFYVPYLGMILKDLAFYEENSKYLINDVLINFEKLENVQIAVSDFFNFKNTTDKDYVKPPEELDFFEDLEDLKETDLESIANNLEPEFKLYENKKREKRPTNIDIKYFTGSNVKRPNMRDSKRMSHK